VSEQVARMLATHNICVDSGHLQHERERPYVCNEYIWTV